MGWEGGKRKRGGDAGIEGEDWEWGSQGLM